MGTITFERVVEIRGYEIIANVLGCDNDTVVRCKCLFMLNEGGVSLSLSNGFVLPLPKSCDFRIRICIK